MPKASRRLHGRTAIKDDHPYDQRWRVHNDKVPARDEFGELDMAGVSEAQWQAFVESIMHNPNMHNPHDGLVQQAMAREPDEAGAHNRVYHHGDQAVRVSKLALFTAMQWGNIETAYGERTLKQLNRSIKDRIIAYVETKHNWECLSQSGVSPKLADPGVFLVDMGGSLHLCVVTEKYSMNLSEWLKLKPSDDQVRGMQEMVVAKVHKAVDSCHFLCVDWKPLNCVVNTKSPDSPAIDELRIVDVDSDSCFATLVQERAWWRTNPGRLVRTSRVFGRGAVFIANMLFVTLTFRRFLDHPGLFQSFWEKADTRSLVDQNRAGVKSLICDTIQGELFQEGHDHYSRTLYMATSPCDSTVDLILNHYTSGTTEPGAWTHDDDHLAGDTAGVDQMPTAELAATIPVKGSGRKAPASKRRRPRLTKRRVARRRRTGARRREARDRRLTRSKGRR